MKTFRGKTLTLVVTAIVLSLYIYRTVFTGTLIGEPFDARLMITLHEHMWRWLNGLVSFRDTEFFYPYQTALGFSDVFLVQGLIYSLFRIVGFDSMSSWLNVTILLTIIGNIGWVFVAKKFINNFVVQILFIATIISSLSFVYYMGLNPNIVGYSFLSWILLLFNSLINEKNPQKKHVKFCIFVLTILIYALSCWYGTFFLLITLVFRFLILFISKKEKIKVSFNLKVMRVYLLFSPAILFFSWLFYFVYITIASQPDRPVDDLIRNSPRIQQILKGANPNGGGIEGSIFSELYRFLNLDTPIIYGEKLGDWGGGLGLFIPIATILVLLLNVFYKKYLKDYSWIGAVALVYSYFLVFGDDNSVHSYFFNSITGLNSIRSPSRYVVFVGYASIFLVFYYFDKIFSSLNQLKTRFLVLAFLLVLVLDQQRSSFKGWDRKEFINAELLATKVEIQKNCDYFYYDHPGGWWFDQIEALTFAVQIGVPTVNGYSGAYPPGYPVEPWNSSDDPLKIFDWIKKIDSSKKGCLVTGRSEIKSLNEKYDSVDFVGFTGLETQGEDSWRWAISQNPYIYIFNDSFKSREISFNVKTSRCFENQRITITDSKNNKIISEAIVNKELSYKLELNMEQAIIKRIQFNTDASSCKIEGDPRDLFFEIKNFKVS